MSYDEEILEAIHDVYLDIERVSLSADNCERIADIMPKHIFQLSQMYGGYDTVFRDEVYVWIRDNNIKKEGL